MEEEVHEAAGHRRRLVAEPAGVMASEVTESSAGRPADRRARRRGDDGGRRSGDGPGPALAGGEAVGFRSAFEVKRREEVEDGASGDVGRSQMLYGRRGRVFVC